MATKVIGLDLGTHTVKVAELVTAFRTQEWVGFGTEPVETEGDGPPTMEEIVMAARRLLERRGLLGETIITSLPSEAVSTVSLDFPFDQPKKIEQVLPFQLEEVIPLDIEDVVWDYQIVKKTEEGAARVLVAYVKETLFARFLETMQAVDLDPKVVGVGPLTFYNLYDALLGEHATAPTAILDLGHAHSELVIFDQGQPVVVRSLSGGGLDITEGLADAFNVDMVRAEQGKHAEAMVGPPGQQTDDGLSLDKPNRQELIVEACREAIDDILREARRSLAAHFDATGHQIGQIYLTGGTSQMPGLRTYIESQLGVNVGVLNPLTLSAKKLREEGNRIQPYVSKAIGSALRGVSRAHQSQINLRKGDYSYTGDFGFLRGRIISVGVSVAVIVILAAMVAVTKKRVLEAETLSLQAQVEALSMEIMGEETDDPDEVLEAMNSKANNPAALIPQEDAFSVLHDFSRFIDYKTTIDVDRMNIDISNNRIEIRGRTLSADDVEAIVESLQKHDCISKVSKDRNERTLDNKTKFTLSMNMNCI
ncbi:MAG: type II secretion system protein GspL [Bradymonadia bacterium]